MRRLVLALGALAACSVVGASAQTQFRTPNGQSAAPLAVTGCLTGAGLAVPCGTDGAPLMTAPASSAGAQAVTQSGTWRIAPRVGTPVSSAVTSLGTTSTLIVAAATNRSWLLIQNPGMVGATANTAGFWCRIDGSAATTAPPSFYVAPGQTWAPGSSSGYMPTADIFCVAATAASPIAASSVP